jgi:ABC-type antimicrobial peptide transport system permease subunit
MPGDAYVTVTPMREILDPNERAWSAGATMFSAFSLLALVVAAIGLYSVIAHDVAQRTHELGVRIALGADARTVLRLVMGRGMRFAVAGVAIGSAVALASGRWVAPLLFSVSPRDPLVFGGVVAVLLAVAMMASAVPALRAARVDPARALRAD